MPRRLSNPVCSGFDRKGGKRPVGARKVAARADAAASRSSHGRLPRLERLVSPTIGTGAPSKTASAMSTPSVDSLRPKKAPLSTRSRAASARLPNRGETLPATVSQCAARVQSRRALMYFCPSKPAQKAVVGQFRPTHYPKGLYLDNRPHGCVGERLWLRLLRDIDDHVLGTPRKIKRQRVLQTVRMGLTMV
jgi:hypothetical protein